MVVELRYQISIKNILDEIKTKEYWNVLETTALSNVHYCRWLSYADFRAWLSLHITQPGVHSYLWNVLGLSGQMPILDLFDTTTLAVTVTTYPQVDVYQLPYNDSSFQLITTDNVLEHLARLHDALKEVSRVLAPTGFVIHTVPASWSTHAAPDDFHRFLPNGLASMTEENGLTVLRLGSWGCEDAQIDFPNDWPYYNASAFLKKHNPRFPILTWVIAQRQTSS